MQGSYITTACTLSKYRHACNDPTLLLKGRGPHTIPLSAQVIPINTAAHVHYRRITTDEITVQIYWQYNNYIATVYMTRLCVDITARYRRVIVILYSYLPILAWFVSQWAESTEHSIAPLSIVTKYNMYPWINMVNIGALIFGLLKQQNNFCMFPY